MDALFRQTLPEAEIDLFTGEQLPLADASSSELAEEGVDELGVAVTLDAARCLATVRAALHAPPTAPPPPWDDAALQACERRCHRWFLHAMVHWTHVLGHGIGAPELLALCLAFLWAARRLPQLHALPTPAPDAVRGHVHAARHLLRFWTSDEEHGRLAAELRNVESTLRRVVVLFCDHIRWFEPPMVMTERRLADATSLSIGIDIHEDFDNRVRDLTVPVVTDTGAAAASTTATPGGDEWHEGAAAEEESTELVCHVITDAEPSDVDPLEVLRLLTRVMGVGHMHRLYECVHATEPLPRPLPHAADVREADCAALDAHLADLRGRHLDESVPMLVTQLTRQQLLSAGALDYEVRFSGLTRATLSAAAALRFDHMRRVSDLEVCQRLATLPLAEVFDGAPDLGERFHDKLPVQHERASLKRLVRGVWTLVLLHHELRSIYDIDWLGQYVVWPQELLQRAGCAVAALRQGRPRLPLLVQLGHGWVLHTPEGRVRAPDVRAAAVLWARHVLEAHDGKTEGNIHIRPVLEGWGNERA